jgi:hypothetical protein
MSTKRSFARSTLLTLLLASSIAATAFAQGSPKGEGRTPSDLVSMLLASAEERGIAIDTSDALSLFNGKVGMVAAPIESFARVPATDLPRGVDAAFAYFSARRDLPAGFYTLRVTAPDVRLGENAGAVQFLDSSGKVVAERKATILVHSLTVPPNAVERVRIVNSTVLGTPGADEVASAQVWILCSNGQWICFDDERDEALAQPL